MEQFGENGYLFQRVLLDLKPRTEQKEGFQSLKRFVGKRVVHFENVAVGRQILWYPRVAYWRNVDRIRNLGLHSHFVEVAIVNGGDACDDLARCTHVEEALTKCRVVVDVGDDH